MAEIPASISFSYTVDASGWLDPIPSVWTVPEWTYKDHPIANPPRVELRRESEWVTQPCGLLVRTELPIIDADTGPKVLTNEPPLVEMGTGMEQRPSGLFAPPKPNPYAFMGGGWIASGDFTFTFEMAKLEGLTYLYANNSESLGISGTLDSLVPALSTASAVCPAKGCERAKCKPLKETIIHLNDHHHWTRESIADWLDTLDIDLTVQRKEPTPDAQDRIRGAKFNQVIYDEVVGFDPAPLASAS